MNNNIEIDDTFDNLSFSTSGNFVRIKNNISSKSKTNSTVENLLAGINFDDTAFLSETFDTSSKFKKLSTDVTIDDFSSPEYSKSINQSQRKVNKSKPTASSTSKSGNPIKSLNITVNKSTNKNDTKDKTLQKVSQSAGAIKSETKETTPCTQNNRTSLLQQQLFEPIAESLESPDIFDKSFSQITSVDLSSWGLPKEILDKYSEKKVTKMFAWQVECLNRPGVLSKNKNLVYSAPTSAGKTLVAEILAIKSILERKKKVVFILPFISVAREKTFYFKDILSPCGVRVEGFMGSYNPPGGFKKVDVAICTIEKANSLINRLLEENLLSKLGAVIVDEMHLLGDPSRGYLLELLLTKLRFMSLKDDEVKIQIIGLSATLPNLPVLANWLDAELYTTNFRPIPLLELCNVNGVIYNCKLEIQRKLTPMQDFDSDTDNILQLCLETIENSCSVLIFCPTKTWCENLSNQIALAIWKLGCSKSTIGLKLAEELKPDLINECLEHLKRCPVGMDENLYKSVRFGVAFHHAGLTMDERDIIENSFKNGGIRVLIATSTLSSGVNLPARRVIIRTPIFNRKPIDILTYKQMIGRAGRMGRDSMGESILICQKNDYNIAKQLLSGDLQPVKSCLLGSGRLKRAILEVIASEVVSSPEEVSLFTKCTLLAAEDSSETEVLKDTIDSTIKFLVDNQFVRLQTFDDGTSKYLATNLAKACLSSSLPPEEGLTLFEELGKARQCFVLETELHLIYLVTPYSACNQLASLDWMLYLNLWEKLPASMKRVGDSVGVQVSYIVSGTRGTVNTTTEKMWMKLQVHKRFFTSLILQDLVNEMPLMEVGGKYGCNKGMLQSLQQSAATFAGMVTSFSKQLGWTCVELLISQFQERLQFGVSRDLLDLMRLPVLTGQLARCLFNAGIETLTDLARTDVYSLETILYKAKPFESDNKRDGESNYDASERNKIRSIFITGNKGLTEREAALMLINEARSFIGYELGLSDIRWEKHEDDNNLMQISTPVIIQNEEGDKNESIKPDNCHHLSTLSNDTSLIKQGDNNKSNCLNLSHVSTPNKDASLINANINISVVSSNKSIAEQSSRSLFEDSFDTKFLVNLSEIENGISDTNDNNKSLNNKRKLRNISSTSINSDDDLFMNTPPTAKKMKYLTPRLSKEFVDPAFVISQNRSNINQESFKTDIEESLDLTNFEIINVCDNKLLFNQFKKELLQQGNISLSLACEKFNDEKLIIGNKNLKYNKDNNKTTYKNREFKGISFTWGSITVYFMSFEFTTNVNKTEKINLLRSLFNRQDLNVKIFDCKEHVKLLRHFCDVEVWSKCEDPKVVDWLLDPEGREKNLTAMILNYLPEAINLCKMCGSTRGVGSVALDIENCNDSRMKSSIEALVCWHLVVNVKNVLENQNKNLLHLLEIEMECILILAKMELFGMKVNKLDMQKMVDTLNKCLKSIESKAYKLVGHRFSFSSTKEVAKILGIYKGKKTSTNKNVLQKCTHPVATLIMQWRKISSIQTRTIYPILRVVEDDNKIYGCFVIHNSTGRITMHEPSIQNVPRNFTFTDPISLEDVSISCRDAFIADDKYVFLSADYCQLELRLLAHFSQDSLLCHIMRSEDDIFKSMSAKWNNVEKSEVTDLQRQKIKQICYGIIYGIGMKALAEQLEVSEEEATDYVESFHLKYPGLRVYINKTVEKCKEVGWVETISGRRRYLGHINHSNTTVAKQAERQAVNTTIQGSAADITKNAMVLVEKKIKEKFSSSKNAPKVILNLHDELIYEIPCKYLQMFAKIFKKCLEESVKLSIPFPVKLKYGKSWGDMNELNI